MRPAFIAILIFITGQAIADPHVYMGANDSGVSQPMETAVPLNFVSSSASTGPTTTLVKTLTVGDVVQIVQAISTLDPRAQFPGGTMIALATIQSRGLAVIQAYNDTLRKEQAKLAKGAHVPQDILAGMIEAPAYVDLPRIKRRDLCLEATTDACSLMPPVKNTISIPSLAALLPLIDQ